MAILEHILQALKRIDTEGVPETGEVTQFYLLYEGQYYPIRYVLSLVSSSKELLAMSDTELHAFLSGLGLQIVSATHTGEAKNTWIFQGNPKTFDINRYITDHTYIWWSMRQKHYVKDIRTGDEVFLWRSGSETEGGVIARCRILGFPIRRSGDVSGKAYWRGDDWKNPYIAVRLEVVERRVFAGYLSRKELKQHPVLKELPVLKQAAGTNYPIRSSEMTFALNALWDNGETEEMKVEGPINLKDVNFTEDIRREVIKQNVNRSKFRTELLVAEKKCKLCGVRNEDFLVVTYIKPWDMATDEERNDLYNTLLLCPNHSTALEKAYISFAEDGGILVSEDLDELSRVFLHINEQSRIHIPEEQKRYIEWHRGSCFYLI